jgi:hypothetical protein
MWCSSKKSAGVLTIREAVVPQAFPVLVNGSFLSSVVGSSPVIGSHHSLNLQQDHPDRKKILTENKY